MCELKNCKASRGFSAGGRTHLAFVGFVVKKFSEEFCLF